MPITAHPEPIATAPRDGTRIAVCGACGTVAVAIWGGKGGMWCYAPPPHHPDMVHQLDFEPVEWATSATTFYPPLAARPMSR